MKKKNDGCISYMLSNISVLEVKLIDVVKYIDLKGDMI